MVRLSSACSRKSSQLSTRLVDLVGDFAGSSLLVIEGDSLLLTCFSDPDLDFQDGFQLLHLVYLVERLLQRLIERKCNVCVVFFDSHSRLSVPVDVLESKQSKYLLAREVAIRQLTQDAPLPVDRFSTLTDPAFSAYLEQKDALCFLCHGGNESPQASQQTDKLRSIITHLLQLGYSVALCNKLEWKDTKVLVNIVEEGRGHQQKVSTASSNSSGVNDPPSLDEADTESPFNLPDDACRAGSLRVQLTCSALMKAAPQDITPAYLLHAIILEHIAWSSRRLPRRHLPAKIKSSLDAFEGPFYRELARLVRTLASQPSRAKSELVDLVDGRLFVACVLDYSKMLKTLPESAHREFQKCCDYTGIQPPAFSLAPSAPALAPTIEGPSTTKLLPFSNAVFDKHLAPVRIQQSTSQESNESPAVGHVFRDLHHWHTTKKVNTKSEYINDPRALKRNQRQMAEMITYSASLTNAAGKILDPTTITADKSARASAPSSSKISEPPTQSKAKASKSDKRQARPSKRELLQQEIAAKQAAKKASIAKAHFESWAAARAQLEKAEIDNGRRYSGACKYSEDASAERRDVIFNDVSLYRIQMLISEWRKTCKAQNERNSMRILAMIVHLLTQLCSLTRAEAVRATTVVKSLGIPMTFAEGSDAVIGKRELTHDWEPPADLKPIPVPWIEFYLLYCGPYMSRDMDSKPDKRVPFLADGWQRAVLDEIDRNHSVFVVAPTSAGKTFISFYAMEQVLRQDDDGVIVYLAPTKALVNQIAAEIQARFSKKYSHASKTMWAVHTRDYRINNPASCQILVTVPHILQIMLLAPENARSWSPKVRRIIFDEVHCIGQAEDGLVWEQLLLLAPCPIIALSATIGNASEFADWVSTTQEALGKRLTTIEHHQRYSDLRKCVYVEPQGKFSFEGLWQLDGIAGAKLGLDNPFTYIHPVTCLQRKSQIPADLTFEPRDCFLLWQAMDSHQSADFPLNQSLAPSTFLPSIPRKVDVAAWEAELKNVLRKWMSSADSPFSQVIKALDNASSRTPPKLQHEDNDKVLDITNSGRTPEPKHQDNIEPLDDTSSRRHPEPQRKAEESFVSGTMPLLRDLYFQGGLPAIIFNYDRSKCNTFCLHVLEELENAEASWKAADSSWKAKIAAFENWQKGQSKRSAKDKAQTTAKVPKKKGAEADAAERMSKLDLAREAAANAIRSPFQDFDPEAPLDQFSFAGVKKALPSEVEGFCRELSRRPIDPRWIRALKRGVAIHHSGCNRKYRQTVEMLFRRGFLQVIFATGTLALGINMPCVTTCFNGDSVFLTALNFKQASGRAGRRGFDLLGNVVFQNINDTKIKRLISSKLPDLSGHFPLTTTLVLRLFSLLHNSKESPFAVKAIDSLLSQPRIYLGGPNFKLQVLHHLRFSIEYLRRQSLLSFHGAPTNFASTVCHLYFTETSNFAFHALLKNGYFHQACRSVSERPLEVKRELMITLANLFGRKKIQPEWLTDTVKEMIRKSSSDVILRPLPKAARRILDMHNAETKAVFENYVLTYVSQNLPNDEDDCLPLSGLRVGADGVNCLKVSSLPAPKIRSAFASLSGLGDDFSSVEDLCRSVRSKVFLEESTIPVLGRCTGPLNAYLYDFWNHEDLRTLEEDNGIRRSDIWFLLKDFSLILATIVTSLTTYIQGPMSELDLIELQDRDGWNDVDEENETLVGGDDTSTSTLHPPSSSPKKPSSEKQTKKKVLDSWDDGTEGREITGSSDEEEDEDEGTSDGHGDLKKVLRSFKLLQADFNKKFLAMWA